MSSSAGCLITFEGPEGSGKTTLIAALAERLRLAGTEPVLLREPGGTAIGEQVRNILLDLGSEQMCGETELLLMVACRAQLVREKILPALAAGAVILCDRFADASTAYQGFGRELGAQTVRVVNQVALAGLVPDLTFLCMLPPQVGQARLVGRHTDRLDRESIGFHAAVYRGYQNLAGSGDPRFRVIDATAPPAAMLAEVLDHLDKLEHGLLSGL